MQQRAQRDPSLVLAGSRKPATMRAARPPTRVRPRLLLPAMTARSHQTISVPVGCEGGGGTQLPFAVGSSLILNRGVGELVPV